VKRDGIVLVEAMPSVKKASVEVSSLLLREVDTGQAPRETRKNEWPTQAANFNLDNFEPCLAL